MILDTQYLLMPDSRRWFEHVGDDLVNRRSCLIVVPDDISYEDIWQPINRFLSTRELFAREVWIPDLPENTTPARFIYDTLGIDCDHNSNLSEAEMMAGVMSSMCSPEVILLDGYSSASCLARSEFCSLLVKWAKQSHNLRDQGAHPPALCMVASASQILTSMPKADIYLSIRWWWGIPTSLDLRVLLNLQEHVSNSIALSSWYESLLPVLSCGDIKLSDHLRGCLTDHFQAIWNELLVYGTKREWTDTLLKVHGADLLTNGTSVSTEDDLVVPPDRYKSLWAIGAIYLSSEHHIEVHTSALAVLGHRTSVINRIWRGQTQLLLPLINSLRIALCSRLTRRHGQSWPYQWYAPPEEESSLVREDPNQCGLGHLRTLLERSYPMQRDASWLPLIRRAQWVRNEIAHYRIVDWKDYDYLLIEYRRQLQNT